MNDQLLLDLGGNASEHRVHSTHLGSGSPKVCLDIPRSKRMRYPSEDLATRIAHLNARLDKDLTEFFTDHKVCRSFALIYADVERLCLASHSAQARLAKHVFDKIDSEIASKIQPRISMCLSCDMKESPVTAAEEFLNICDDWIVLLTSLSKLFLYLDRSYLLHHPKHPSIKNHGIQSLLKAINTKVDSQDAKQRKNDRLCALVASLLRETRSNRSNLALYNLTKRLISTLKRVDVGHILNANNSFESIIVDEYFASKKKWMLDEETYVLNLLRSMNDDSNLLLESGENPDVVRKIFKDIRWNFLLVDLNYRLAPALPILTTIENRPYFQALKALCGTSMADYGSDSMNILLLVWRRYVEIRAKRVPLDSEIITNILSLWQDLNAICQQGVKSNLFAFEVRYGLANAFKSKDFSGAIVNSLSRFCDTAMKQTNKSNEIISDLKDKMLIIFKLISDKLAFISVYERDLSKRILMSKNFDSTAEEQIVDAIESVLGETEVNIRLRVMLRDYVESKASYSHVKLPNAQETDFSALVLEKKIWPDVPGFSEDVCLPQALKSILKDFEVLFGSNEKRKVLDWKSFMLHQITFTAHFAAGPKELEVNLSQAVVLMLFEESDVMSITQILESTKMGERLLRRVLGTLSTSRYPILQMSGDLVSFNDSFTDKSSKIKLVMGKEKDTSPADEPKAAVERGRSSECRSTLVRIMKSEGTLIYTELLGKAIEALTPRGVPNVQDLKTEIEYLISMDYLARDADGKNLTYIP
ncbi:hypothetical protein OXX59_008476 [Metschnikowia pulcherrima]